MNSKKYNFNLKTIKLKRNSPTAGCLFARMPPLLTCWHLAANQLQLDSDPLVPKGWIDPHKPGLDGGDEVIPHLMQVVDVALENLPKK